MRVRTRIFGIALAGVTALVATATAAGQVPKAAGDTTATARRSASKSGADSTKDAVLSGSQLPSLGPRSGS